MLLEARYEDTGEPMPDEQIIDEILVLIIAGHETTADTLSWLLYLLASAPEVMVKIRERAARTTDNESVKDEYLQAVINEAMRIYPAAWITERVALEDDSFDGFSYPKGTVVLPFFYGIHRAAEYWPEPMQFRPERFLDEQNRLLRPKNYFPFGAGPRMCIGNNFAMAEMTLFLHAFFREFTLTPTGQTPELWPLLTLRPDKVLLNVTKNAS